MYYVVKTKNNIPFILGQFEDINDAFEEADEDCIVVGNVEESLKIIDEATMIIQTLHRALLEEKDKQKVLEEILFSTCYRG